MRRKLTVVLAGGLVVGGLLSPAIGQEMTQMKGTMPTQEQMQEQAYGWQLMSDQERQEYRQQMQQMKTDEERAAFRRLHHEQMEERAREMGVTLPPEPGPMGKGMGPGMGKGMGPGGTMPGGGMGPKGGMGGGKQ